MPAKMLMITAKTYLTITLKQFATEKGKWCRELMGEPEPGVSHNQRGKCNGAAVNKADTEKKLKKKKD